MKISELPKALRQRANYYRWNRGVNFSFRGSKRFETDSLREAFSWSSDSDEGFGFWDMCDKATTVEELPVTEEEVRGVVNQRIAPKSVTYEGSTQEYHITLDDGRTFTLVDDIDSINPKQFHKHFHEHL